MRTSSLLALASLLALPAIAAGAAGLGPDPGPPPWEAAPAGLDHAVAEAVALMDAEAFEDRERGSELAAELPAPWSRRFLEWSRKTTSAEARDRLARAAREIFERSVLPCDPLWAALHGWIGVEWRANDEIGHRYGIDPGSGEEGPAMPRAMAGLLVTGVFPGTPADVAGLRRGDLVVMVDGAPPGADGFAITLPGDVRRALDQAIIGYQLPFVEGFPAGSRHSLSVLRQREPEGGWADGEPAFVPEGAAGEVLGLSVTAAERPVTWSEEGQAGPYVQWARERARDRWFGPRPGFAGKDEREGQ